MFKALTLLACGLLLSAPPVEATASLDGCQNVVLLAPAELKGGPSPQARTYARAEAGERLSLVREDGSLHYTHGYWLLRRADGRRYWVQRTAFECASANAQATGIKPGWNTAAGKGFSKSFLANCNRMASQASGISAAEAKALCSCTLKALQQQYTVNQLMKLEAEDNQAFNKAVEAITSRCARQQLR